MICKANYVHLHLVIDTHTGTETCRGSTRCSNDDTYYWERERKEVKKTT
jgi:hypothetical protein